MIRFLQITGIILGMHVVGTAILFGYTNGPISIFAAPFLCIFGWPLIIPETIGVGLQWTLYEPYLKPSINRFLCYALASAMVGAIVAAPFIPKESGNELTYWVGGLLAGAGAAFFSFFCIHMIKIRELNAPNMRLEMNELLPYEYRIEGQWLFDGKVAKGDESCERIKWLISDVLEKVGVDETGWKTLYKDPNDNRLWILDYPKSHMHGGGPPSLRLITDKESESFF